MKLLFLDTNVVIDFLADRRPFSLFSAALFDSAAKGKSKVFISAVSYNNIYYILRQSLKHPATLKLLEQLSDLVEIADVTKAVIKKSLTSDFKDFEDAIQYNCALTISKLDCIVTRNSKDFRKSVLPVLAPEEALSMLQMTTK